MTTRIPPSSCFASLLPALLWSASCITVANAASTDEAVVLSPFTVSTSKDQGYDTQETLSGTRLKTPNKFVGAAISEVNQQFMQDLAIFSVKEIIDFTANAVAYDNGRMGNTSDQTTNSAITQSNQYTIRGGFTSSTSRDFVTTRVATDGYNIDRVSVDRGPNSILFGIGAPQGIVNVTPTRAEFKNAYQVGLRVDNWGSVRENVRINQQLVPNKAAVFIAQMAENSKTNQKPSDKKRDRVTGAVSLRPFSSTTIRAMFEHGHLNDLAVRPWPVQDGLSAWRAAGSKELPPELQNGGALFASTFTVTAAQNAQKPALAAQMTALGFQFPFKGNFALPMKIFNSAGGTAMPWINDLGLAVTRYNLGVGPGNIQNATLINSPIPYTANVPGFGQQLDIRFNNQDLIVEQAIGRNLFVQATFNRQYAKFLTNNTTNVSQTWLMMDKNPTLLTIDNRIITNPNYNRYFTISGNPSVIWHNYFDEAKVVQAAYKFDFREHLRDGWLARFLGHHNLLGLRQRTQFRDSTRNEALSNASPLALRNVTPQLTGNTFTAANGAGSEPLQIISYLDPSDSSSWAIPDLYAKFGGYKSVFAGGNLPPADPSGVTPFWRVTSSTKSLQIINSEVIVLQSYLWDERIVPTFGLRKDTADNRTIPQALATFNGLTGWTTDSSSVDIYEGDATHPLTYSKQVGRTRTMGIVTYPIRQFGVFFNQSNNFSSVATANVDQFGKPLPPSTAIGRDWGIKLPLWSGKVFATINRYTVKQKDVANSLLKNGFGGPFTPNGVLFRISGDLYNLTQDPRFQNYPWISSVTNQTWSGTNDGWFKGYELNVTANPTKNWRISVSGARQFDAASNFGQVEQRWHDTQLAYLEKNYPTLLDAFTGTASIVNGQVTNVRGQFADYQLAINQALTLAGRRDTRQPEWTGNVVTGYDFISGPLRNFGVGGSFRYRSKVTIGYAFQKGSTALYNADQPFYGPSRNPIGLFASYRFKLNRTRGLVQLNADSINFSENLYPYFATDDGTGKPIIARWAVGQGTTWALSFKFDL